MFEYKNYRKYELKYYIVANIIILIIGKQDFINIFNDIRNIDVMKNLNTLLCFSSVSIVIYIIIFVLDSLLPGRVKWKMCFWLFPEPAEVIFDDIKMKDNDDRFFYEELHKKCKKIYKKLDNCDDTEQKRRVSKIEWYKIYSKYDHIDKIISSKRDYVITRDLYICTIFMIIISIIVNITLDIDYIPKWYFVFECLELLLLKHAVRMRGDVLCRNVLAVHLTK